MPLIQFLLRLVSPPVEWAASERVQLEAYSLRDTSSLAEKSGLSFGGEVSIWGRDRLWVSEEALSKLG
ncbi:MAG: hypothetical protein AAF719_06700 [Pseudomonadota bacterium]